MDRPADVGSEHRIDAAVLLDPAHAGELRRGDGGPEVIPASREVGHLGASAGKSRLDALLQFVGRRHRKKSSGRYPF